jgi:L-lactate dehydrogenase
MRVGVIGMGWVGSSVAISTLQAGFVTRLLVNDLKREMAEGEAMDLSHGAAFYPSADVIATDVGDMMDTDAVVIAAGRGGKANETRLDLLRDNAAVVCGIAKQLTGYKGIIVVVTNPVDVLTKLATMASGLPPSRVVGTGTMLDTARLRHLIGQVVGVEPRSVHASVVGEHGDSEVVLWSQAHIGGTALARWPEWNDHVQSEITARVRNAAYEIIRRKGATNHAIGLVTAALLKCLLRDEERVLTLCRLQEGALGIRDVALSLPCVVGAQGAARVLEPDMSREEHEAVLRSATLLQAAADALTSKRD